ncbi:SAM-dependent methyltransferase [Xanthobacter tagetidis]|uniref:Class I SAM-dependent methyltransferase n=1 Tax=Xanthobacter tagetidis TaxID=60216 RepID=A0A3L7APV7_9HYPH|nr:class I SAM-dependent methyltransferase [Xanthobacter tagetidis]MBB6307857.1 SAM-dependent methyltransferase [Xanthobacter tagetidis]RLP81518.1 class I SAM-dependent methyltransferase [Xanthobacter tagetidis]
MNGWDKRFAGEEFLFGEAPNAFLARQAPLLKKGQRVLAVADGEARNGVWLAEQGLSVHSMDFSSVAQAKARQFAARRGVTLDFELADLLTWEFPPEAYDVVATIFIQFMPPQDRARVFAGMKRTLKPGGLLIMEGYRPEQIAYGTGGPSDPTWHYTEDLLRAEFSDFEIIELASYDAELNEGSRHKGPSALIDIVARKPG